MEQLTNWYAPILTVATAIPLYVAFLAWRRRQAAGAVALILMMVSIALWSGALLVQWVFTDHSPSLAWLVVRIVGVVGAPTASLLMAAQYTGRTKYLGGWRLWTLIGVAIALPIMYATDPLHHLMLGKYLPAMRALKGGPLMPVSFVYFYALLSGATAMVLASAVQSRGVHRMQALLIALCLALPVAVNLADVIGRPLIPVISATPVTFALTGPLFAFALFRLGLLDLAPVARYRLVEDLPDGVIILDHLGRLADINPAARTMTGLGTVTEASLGRPIEDVIPAWRGTIEAVNASLGVENGVVQVNSPIDHERIIEITISRLAQSIGAAPARIVVLRDITQRALVTARLAAQTEALTATREYSDLVLSTIKEGVVLVDGEGTWLHANDAMRRILGQENGADALSSPSGQVAPMMRRVLDAGESERMAIELPDGRTIAVEALPLEGAASVGPRAMFVARDETERVKAERLQREFIANVSHEMKTPLTRLSLIADTLTRESGAGPERIELLAEMLESDVKRTVRMTEEFIALSRVEHISEVVAAAFADVDLSGLVLEVLRRGVLVAEQSGIDLRWEIEPGLVVWGDERSLEMASSCLIDNALRYTDAGGSITVSLSVERVRQDMAAEAMGSVGPEIVLVVADTGVGISPENQALVFERFFRVDKARSRRTGGTGLGLAIVKQTVENHGGSVLVASEIRVGSTFTVRLPLVG